MPAGTTPEAGRCLRRLSRVCYWISTCQAQPRRQQNDGQGNIGSGGPKARIDLPGRRSATVYSRLQRVQLDTNNVIASVVSRQHLHRVLRVVWSLALRFDPLFGQPIALESAHAIGAAQVSNLTWVAQCRTRNITSTTYSYCQFDQLFYPLVRKKCIPYRVNLTDRATLEELNLPELFGPETCTPPYGTTL